MAASPRAGDLLMSAVAQRDFSLVRTYISHGVPVNASDRTLKETPLHAAASQGDLKIVEFLVLQGADVNMLDRFGDSPLELAAAHAHDATANFLSQRGAQRVRGTDAQRKKAMHDLVEEDIKSLDK